MDNTRSPAALLVDDEPASRTANLARLRNQGYLVTVAENATEALSRVRQWAPNIIFVHLVANRLGNLDLIQALRSNDGCRHIPIVVVTNHLDVRMEKTKLR